ncbi:oxygenase MpaB family protein [Nocardioides jejuensis]|nr:oxygenase MpaB family protein [Nocardioides jejuensis]
MADSHLSPGTPTPWTEPEADPAAFTHGVHDGLGLLMAPTAALLMFGAWSSTVFAWAPASPLAAAMTATGFIAAVVLVVRSRNADRQALDLASVALLAGSLALAIATGLHLRELGKMDPLGPLTLSRIVAIVWIPTMVILPLVLLHCIRTLRAAGLPERAPSGLLRLGGFLAAAPLLVVALGVFIDPARAARWIPFEASALDLRAMASIQLAIGVGILHGVRRAAPRDLAAGLAGLITYTILVIGALVVLRSDVHADLHSTLAVGIWLALLAGVAAAGVLLHHVDRDFPEVFAAPTFEPAEDFGFYGPGSVTWKVWSYPTSLTIGFQRAVVIEELDPHLVAAVTKTHGIYDRPRTRYDRTLRYFAMVAFGDSRSTAKAADVLVRIHAKGIGLDPETGTRYDANDPDSQLWILLTGWHSILMAYERYGPGQLSAEEDAQYWAECARAAELQTCDPDQVPRSREGVRAYFEEMRPQLIGSESARAAMHHLLQAEVMLPPMSPLLRPATVVTTRILRRGTLATMPPWMREMSGLPVNPLLDAAVRPVLRAAFWAVSLNTAVQLMLLRIISPMTLPLAGPVLQGLPAQNQRTLTPRQAQAEYGFEAPSVAHADFRATQVRRVFSEGTAPQEDGILESQPILGNID